MRLFLLPISTRRTLLYCQRLDTSTTKDKNLVDKVTTKATALWARWEQKDSGWQKKVVEAGNRALKRIPYEEWGLKSVPPLSRAKREAIEALGQRKVELMFPTTFMNEAKAFKVLKSLAIERQRLHQRRMLWSIIGMPLTAPFALLPIIPNLPFFYLLYRAWSHWRAISGSRHVEFLLDKKLIRSTPSKLLNELYPVVDPMLKPQSGLTEEDEAMVLHPPTGKLIARDLKVPELELELERATWQVEKALNARREYMEEKRDLESAHDARSKSETKK